MRRIPKVFGHSSNRIRTGDECSSGASSSSTSPAAKMKPKLDRRNARKDIKYEYLLPSDSSSSRSSPEEFMRTRSLDLYDGSFRIEGVDGEIEIICRTLGFSGIDDFSIDPEEYEAMKVRSSSAPVAFIQAIEPLVDTTSRVDNDAVDLYNLNGKDVDLYNLNGKDVDNGTGLKDSVMVTDVTLSNGKSSIGSNESRGNGIKGVRPPLLNPPPPILVPVIDKECTTWDIFRAFTPDSGTQVSKFGLGFCLDEEREGLKKEGDEDEVEDRRSRGIMREENCVHSASCSFTASSNDDDTSSTTTEPTLSISPNVRFKRVISEWLKGDLLGRGSFGSVYEGIADDGFFFAVKEVSLLDQEDEGKQRLIQLEQEIALLSQFEHENIVQYYGTKKDESNLYIFLELVTKGSLLSLYQKYNLRDSQVSAYTRQILHGLKYLHDRNVVHRDIKCANILVDTNGLVKLADFGLAKATKLNDVKSCKGTALWMAPEVVRSLGYGLPADIWSLGCSVLEMLTRRFPYSHLECQMAALFRIGKGERPEIPDSLSNDARYFILKCLQVDPNSRPTAAQLLDHPFVKRPLNQLSSGLTSPQFSARQI
ncbi:mitogen-activated protein kinase kinase kinase [Striga asiatica]|uniref:mitogen-activated protein kinase kinase kinase n=1 Tax=Striga asiatica TaxID=4170 RepID=A0A5A7P415_STRAF|nr:mitogen-activated protein kinase kinase kinase [Striga asiatica]